MTEWLLLILAILLVLACGIFVAAEFSFVTVDRATVESEAATGDKRSVGLLKALRTLSTQLSGAQVGITVTSLVIGFIAEPSLAALLRGPVGLTGLSDGATAAVSLGLALAIATCFQMIVGELVPKNWALSEPLRVGRTVQAAQRGFTKATLPVINLLNGTANWILGKLGIEAKEELASGRTPEELASLVRRSSAEGTLDPTTAHLVSRSIGFGDHTAADVMTPRMRVRFVKADATAADVLAKAAATGHARYPVIGRNSDDIIGMVHFKDALAVPAAERESRLVRSLMVPPVTVPESLDLDDVLDVIRGEGMQAAVVIDEYGGTAGVVTLEDLVEEIIGEISDEQDNTGPAHRFRSDGRWSLAGLLRPDEVSEVIGVVMPEGEHSETLGGLLVEHLGRLPETADTVTLRCPLAPELSKGRGEEPTPTAADVTFMVTKLDGRRIDRVTASVRPVPVGEQS